jgi:hypothetical protein
LRPPARRAAWTATRTRSASACPATPRRSRRRPAASREETH